jgi:flagellar hook-length control protein FliK
MSEISRSAPPAPKPAAAPANRSQTGNASEQGGDAFAALLSMVADTRAAADNDASPGGPSVADGEASDTPDDDNNPVAQLLGWADPGSVGRASAAAPAATTPAATLATATATATGISDTTGKDKPAGLDISGMTALAKPEAIDPASLPPGAIAARAVAGQAEGRDARTTGVRRAAKTPAGNDPAAALRASATSLQAQPVAAGRTTALGGVAETARGRGAAWAASTVSMDLSAARETGSVAGNAVSLTARLSELLTGKAQADGAVPTPLLGALQDASGAKSEGPSPADLLPMPDAATDAEPSPLSHWSTQNLRHAHLRLGNGGLDSLDIRLSMQGQDLSVDFRSDNADIRQSLAQQANQSLASLLERSGIALADVSVGAQHRQPGGQGASGDPGQGQGTAQNGRGAIGRADASDAALAARSLAQPALRADGSRPLDLFV